MKPNSLGTNSLEADSQELSASRTPAKRSAVSLCAWIAFCLSASASAIFVSTDGWFAALNKPSWNPPSWVFGPVWTTLYIMMAISAWLVWREGGWKSQRMALGVFLLQWLLNALWTPLFFGLHQLGLAFAEIILLWLVLAVTAALFWRVRKMAGWLLLPYLAWVTFAATLNYSLWRLDS